MYGRLLLFAFSWLPLPKNETTCSLYIFSIQQPQGNWMESTPYTIWCFMCRQYHVSYVCFPGQDGYHLMIIKFNYERRRLGRTATKQRKTETHEYMYETNIVIWTTHNIVAQGKRVVPPRDGVIWDANHLSDPIAELLTVVVVRTLLCQQQSTLNSDRQRRQSTTTRRQEHSGSKHHAVRGEFVNT